MTFTYFIIYKPYGYTSQFSTNENNLQTLAKLFNFSKDVYPIGRLDKDSEGLLLLTNDKKLNHRLLNPKFAHSRTYWVQVENTPTSHDLEKFQKGIEIRVKKQVYFTKPAKVTLLTPPPNVFERKPPIRTRKHIPTAWLSLTLTEGKNRQVRRMTAKVGYPTLRLIRHSIEGLTIEGLKAGEVKQLTQDFVYKSLFNK